jgi:hypothetical protein
MRRTMNPYPAAKKTAMVPTGATGVIYRRRVARYGTRPPSALPRRANAPYILSTVIAPMTGRDWLSLLSTGDAP